jgi:hypothetical protein
VDVVEGEYVEGGVWLVAKCGVAIIITVMVHMTMITVKHFAWIKVNLNVFNWG